MWANTPPQSQVNPPQHILVVEDDVSLRQLSTEVLSGCGYAVDASEDGAAAWQALNTDSYDLLITDNDMPKVSGVELLRKLRAARMDLPVIMATGAVPTAEFARCPWLQPTAMLIKPYDVMEMLRTVKKVLCEADATTHAPWRPTRFSQRILVVDEDRDLRLLYADALPLPSYHVDFAADGAAGWEALQTNNYNLLITEHVMPRLTGVELVRKLRAAHMALPVMMAAGRLPVHELARNPSLQLAATLSKPFAVEVLLATVKNVLHATSPSEQFAAPDWQSQPVAAGLRL